MPYVEVGKFRFLTELPTKKAGESRRHRGEESGGIQVVPGPLSARKPSNIARSNVALMPYSARQREAAREPRPLLGSLLFPTVRDAPLASTTTQGGELVGVPLHSSAASALLPPVGTKASEVDNSGALVQVPLATGGVPPSRGGSGEMVQVEGQQQEEGLRSPLKPIEWIPGRSMALEAWDGQRQSSVGQWISSSPPTSPAYSGPGGAPQAMHNVLLSMKQSSAVAQPTSEPWSSPTLRGAVASPTKRKESSLEAKKAATRQQATRLIEAGGEMGGGNSKKVNPTPPKGKMVSTPAISSVLTEGSRALEAPAVDDQVAETRYALTKIGERLLYQMDMIQDAKEFGTPHDLLPSKCKYNHLHPLKEMKTIGGVNVSAGGGGLRSDQESTLGTAEAQRKKREQDNKVFDAYPAGSDKRRALTPEIQEDPPNSLKLHLLLHKDAYEPPALQQSLMLPSVQSVTRATQLQHQEAGGGGGVSQGQGPSTLRTKAVSSTTDVKTKKKKFFTDEKLGAEKTAGGRREKKQTATKKKVETNVGATTVGGRGVVKQGTSASDANLVVGDEADFYPQQQKLLQPIALGQDGVISLPEIANAAQRQLDRERTSIRQRNKDSVVKQQARLDLHDRTQGNIYANEVIRSVENQRGKTFTGSEDDVEAVANLKLYQKVPALFAPTGEDTDVGDFPSFPFAPEARRDLPAVGASAFRDGGDPTASANRPKEEDLTDEERLHRKFERRLLVRQLQRNRAIVDEQDDPALDWQQWRQAANNSLRSVRPPNAEELADRMQFTWREVATQVAEERQRMRTTVSTLAVAKHTETKAAPDSTDSSAPATQQVHQKEGGSSGGGLLHQPLPCYAAYGVLQEERETQHAVLARVQEERENAKHYARLKAEEVNTGVRPKPPQHSAASPAVVSALRQQRVVARQ